MRSLRFPHPALPTLLASPGAALAAFLVLATLTAGCWHGGGLDGGDDDPEPWEEANGNCIGCHANLETAHPYFPLGCAQCHGGNPEGLRKEEAHVTAKAPLPDDATVLPMDYFDLEYLRFLNPSNLRVVGSTCGQSGQGLGTACHENFAVHLQKSMMATTPGHLVAGAYQNGLLSDLTPVWGNMPVEDLDGDIATDEGAVPYLEQVPGELTSFPDDSFARHYSDVPRKVCARCHLWSRGAAGRGMPEQEGNYRSEGCAACHMEYTNDARSESADPNIDHDEPGHPRVHTLSKTIRTTQCAHCHTRGARIGLSVQGLAQLPPGTATGPDYPGLTPEKIYGDYHVQDPEVNPPDVHIQAGLACIDCHVRVESMGDGDIFGHMDQATQIECEDCHGTFDAYGTGVTGKGTVHEHLRWEGGVMILTGKVDGLEHFVPQVRDIVDPSHPSYSAVAAAAMNGDHLAAEGKLECYTCHSAWQNNCYGCHFERDLRESSLDLIAGEETPGRVGTDQKYFLNFKNFHMGYNAEGKIAPYITGCQPVATVIDAGGELLMFQKMPVTARGLSGLALNPVQPHTTRPVSRFCEECHRNPAALGLGTESFHLTRRHLFLLTPSPTGSLRVVDRRDMTATVEVGSLSLADPRELLAVTDQVLGRTTVAYVADGVDGLVVVDLSDPTLPERVTALPVADPRALAQAGATLFVAAGAGGVHVFDLTDPRAPTAITTFPTTDARGLAVHGIHLLVADGDAGLVILDVTDRTAPLVAGSLDLNGGAPGGNDARDVFPMAHYFNPPEFGLKPTLMIAYVADGANGVRIVSLADPKNPILFATHDTVDAHAVFAKSHYDIGNATTKSREREYLFVADGTGGLQVADVSFPFSPSTVTTLGFGFDVTDFAIANAFEPPVNRLFVYAALGSTGTALLDWSTIDAPVLVDLLAIPVTSGVAIESVRLDRLCDEDGVQIKDVSHDGARTFDRAEIEAILGTDY